MKSLPLTSHMQLILGYLLDNGTVNKSQISAVITSPPILNRELDKLKNEGFVSIREIRIGRRMFKVELTEEGRNIAEQIRRTQYAAEGISPPDVVLTPEVSEKMKDMRLLIHVNVRDDHITVLEKQPSGPDRVINIYVKENGQRGFFRLWCELDESFNCVHAQVAWTYPEVQYMFAKFRGQLKGCPACGVRNDQDAKFCKNCGIRL